MSLSLSHSSHVSLYPHRRRHQNSVGGQSVGCLHVGDRLTQRRVDILRRYCSHFLFPSPNFLSPPPPILSLSPFPFSFFNHSFSITGDDHKLYCLSLKTGKQEDTLDAHEAEVVGVVHHPLQNLVVTYAVDGSLKFWKP